MYKKSFIYNIRRAVSAILVMIMLFSEAAPAINVHAADIHYVPVETRYMQTEARKQLDMVNAFRTGDEAWHYDEAGNKVSDEGLGELLWDYGLERAAYIRAVEAAVYFDHTRPNGKKCFTVLDNGIIFAENLAGGHSSSAVVIEAWKESDKDYGGQGHRRNMLDHDAVYMAAAGVNYNGTKYWVQLFGIAPADTGYTEADDDIHTDLIEADIAEGAYIMPGAEDGDVINVRIGTATKLPSMQGVYQINGSSKKITMDLPVSWSLADPAYGKIEEGYITAASAGKCELHGDYSFLDTVYSVEITLDSEIHATSVGLNYSEITVVKGESISLNTILTPEDATDGDVTFSSNDESVAVVSSNGIITAVGEAGSRTKITAATKGGLSADCAVNITDDPVIKATEAEDFIYELEENGWRTVPGILSEGDLLLTNPAGLPGYTVVTDDPGVAYVSEGAVYAAAPGTTKLRLETGEYYGKKYSFSWDVKVTADPAESDEDSYIFSMKYGQTQARKFEKLVNDFRTGSEAWYYDKNNKKVYVNDLQKLNYSYELEEAAMQRAAEAAIMFSHTRPDGSSCWTVVGDIYSYGENLAAGYSTADATMNQWKETDEDYNGQGHRRNMLNSSYRSFAVGHVSYQGYDYWAMALSKEDGSGEVKTVVLDSDKDVNIKISPSYISFANIIADTDNNSTIELEMNKAKTLPAFSGELSVSGHFPSSYNCTVKAIKPEWKLEDESFADISDGKISAKKYGSCKLTATISLSGKKTTYNYKLHVKCRPESVELNPASSVLPVDGTLQLEWNVYPAEADDKSVSFESSDKNVAKVSGTGLVTAVGAGVCDISVKTNDGGKTAKCSISVSSQYAVAAPKAVPGSGEVEAGSVVVLGCDTPDAKIYYTTDGTAPDSSKGILYKNGIVIDKAITVKAVAFKNDVYSGVSVFSYTIAPENWGDVIAEDRAQWTKASDIPQEIWVAEASVPEETYNGTAHKPAGLRVYLGKKILGSDEYTISYRDNINAGNAVAVFKFKRNIKGSLEQKYTIKPADIDTAVASTVFVTYTGSVVRPVPTVVWKDKTLKEFTDYKIDDTQSYKDAGTYNVKITGIGNFEGSTTFELVIGEAKGEDLATAKVSKIPAQLYTEGVDLGRFENLKDSKGQPLSLNVTLGSEKLIMGQDYKVNIIGADKPGTALLHITSAGNRCFGCKSVSFTIKARSLKKYVKADKIAAQSYTGEAIVPEVNVTDKKSGAVLKQGVHYTVSCTKNINAGSAKVTISGIETAGYSGSITKKFKIEKCPITGAKVEYSPEAVYIKGGAVPEVKVELNGRVLIKDVDYTVKCSDNKRAGAANASFVIQGKGSYSGKTAPATFSVRVKNIAEVEACASDIAYSGIAGKYKTTLTLKDKNGKKLKAGTDYDSKLIFRYDEDCMVGGEEAGPRSAQARVRAGDIIPAGTVLQVVTRGCGNYEGTVTARYKVCKNVITKAKATIASKEYTGSAITLNKADIRLECDGVVLSDDDYEIISYTANIKPGTAKVTVRGTGNYGGEKTLSFKIIKRNIQ